MVHEVVVGCLGMRACDVAEAACHSRFHFKSRKFAGNSLDFIWRDEVELQADDIQTDAGGAHITSDSL
jgi:endonuclease/exonuclease/phosphatase (EEP) superfamily protein YafD